MTERQRLFRLTLAAILLLTGISFPAQARWATAEDSLVVIRYHHGDLTIDAEGKTESIIEQETEITRDGGRAYGTMKIPYSEESDELKLLEVATIHGETRTPVEPKDIEDKPLSSGNSGFDSTRQLLISFPNVVIGSRLYVKYRYRQRVAPISGFFSYRYEATSASGAPVLESRFTVRSALPLHWEPVDPLHVLSVTQSEKNGEYFLEVASKKPILQATADEEAPIFLGSDRFGGILSTSTNPATAFQSLAARYEAEAKKPLPALFAEIAIGSARIEPLTDQIDFVTSRLNEKVRYMGDWRTVHGKFVPRGHEAVIQSGSGDCKDFATSTAAILRATGIDAHLALVERGQFPDAMPHLPLLSSFNHVIVRVRAHGKTLWIDPTSDRSFATGIPEDIIDRKALVLLETGPELDTIPLGTAPDSVSYLKERVDWTTEDEQKVDWSMRLTGTSAWGWTGAQRNRSKQSLDRLLASQVATMEEITSFDLNPYELRSRITTPLELGGRARTHFTTIRTSAGVGFWSHSDGLAGKLTSIDWANRVTRFYLGYPRSLIRETELTGVSLVGKKLVPCSVDSPWLRISRTNHVTQKGVAIREEMEIRSRYIETEQFRAPEFAKWTEAMKACRTPLFILNIAKHRAG